MEDAVVQGLDQEGAHHLVGQGVGVETRQVHQGRIGHRQARRPLQRQHALADPVPDDGGGRHIAVLGHDLGQLRGGGRLQPHVQLQRQGAGDDLDKGLRLQPPGGFDELLHQLGAQTHGIQTARHAALDAGTQHLDRHLATVGEVSRVSLGQRGGGDRGAQIAEQALDRAAQRAFDLGAGLVQREGRQLVLQSAQILGELDAEDVGAGGQNLTQLDGHGAEVFKRLPDALAGPTSAVLAAGRHLHQPRERPRPGGQQGIDLARDQGVVTRQNPAPADQAQAGAQRVADGFRARRGRRGLDGQPAQIAHPWWMAAIPPDRLVTLTRLKPASSIMRLNVA